MRLSVFESHEKFGLVYAFSFMISAFAGSFLLLGDIVEAAGPTIVPVDQINTDTTWSLENSPYVVQGRGYVEVNAALTIEPGVVVKFRPHPFRREFNGIRVNSGGRILADASGTSTIVFTSYRDDSAAGDTDNSLSFILPARGDWRGLVFNGDSGSELKNVEIRYGGNIFDSTGNVEIRGRSNVEIVDSEIANSASSGVVLFADADAELGNLVIRDNADFGIDTEVSGGTSVLSNSAVSDNAKGQVRMSPSSRMGFENNSFGGSGPAIIELKSDTVVGDAVWPKLGDLVYVIWKEGKITVREGASLTIEPGVVVKMYTRSGLFVEGLLEAEGEEGSPIVFTSWKNDNYGGDTNLDGASLGAAGDWGGIFFNGAEASGLKNIVVEYGGVFADDFSGLVYGFVDRNLVHVENSKVEIFNAVLRHGFDTGLYASGVGNLSFSSSTVDNVPRAVDIYTDSPWSLEQNRFSNNSVFALRQDGDGRVDARNNWWGNDSGPTHADNPDGTGGAVFGDVLFDPWVGKVPERNPVLLVPGILGSELELEGDLLWSNLDKMFADVGDEFMNALEMDENGESVSEVEVVDVIRKKEFAGVATIFDYFESLIEDLEDLGYSNDNDFFVFPNDWRQDNRKTAEQLKAKIDQIISETGAQKVDIVAHSMGGLVTKQYILDEGEEKIENIIFIGTPHLGSPGAAKTLLFGDTLGIKFVFPFLNPERIKFLGQNMRSIFQLLPSRKYIEDNGAYIYDLTQRQSFDYIQTKEFLKANGLNERHIADGENFHSNELDNFSVENINLYTINGCTQPSLQRIVKRGDDEYTIQLGPGDGTVQLNSAEGIFVPEGNRFYARDALHSRMPSQDGIREVITAIVDNTLDTNSLPSNISQAQTGCAISGRLVSVHSPVEFEATDASGNKIGPDENGDVEIGIPGGTHFTLGGNKFLFLPDSGEPFDISLTGTSTGTFRLRVTDYNQNEITASSYFHDVPVNSSSTGRINFDENGEPRLEYDELGDGSSETITPSTGLIGESANDLSVPTTTAQLSATLGENGWYTSVVTTTLVATDTLAGVWRTEYSLDKGESWQVYSEPLVFADGIHNLLFRSIDRAGNIEAENHLEIKVDTVAPEILFAFDRVGKGLMVSAFDTNSSTVRQSGGLAEALDEAGNKVTVRHTLEESEDSLKMRFFSIAYNMERPKRLQSNAWQMQWLEANNETKVLRQRVRADSGQRIMALHRSVRGRQFERERPREKTLPRQLRHKSQLNLFTIQTNRGELVYNF